MPESDLHGLGVEERLHPPGRGAMLPCCRAGFPCARSWGSV